MNADGVVCAIRSRTCDVGAIRARDYVAHAVAKVALQRQFLSNRAVHFDRIHEFRGKCGVKTFHSDELPWIGRQDEADCRGPLMTGLQIRCVAYNKLQCFANKIYSVSVTD